MWRWTEPKPEDIAVFRAAQAALPHSYPEVGQTRATTFPPGYEHDRNRVRLGAGEATFVRGCEALRRWAMFPGPWTRIEPQPSPQTPGAVVVMVARIFGLWWMNALRIVYSVDESEDSPGSDPEVRRRHGFAYGTLPGHVERGEEAFTVVWRADDSVWYELQAFSRPRYWLVRWFKPVARALQRRFVRQSLALMQAAVR